MPTLDEALSATLIRSLLASEHAPTLMETAVRACRLLARARGGSSTQADGVFMGPYLVDPPVDMHPVSLAGEPATMMSELARHCPQDQCRDIVARSQAGCADFFKDAFGLDALETTILHLCLRGQYWGLFKDVLGIVERALNQDVVATLAAITGSTGAEVEQRIASDSRLFDSGLLLRTAQQTVISGPEPQVDLSSAVRRVRCRSFLDYGEWETAVLGRPVTSLLEMRHYAHLGETAGMVRDLLAADDGKPGINVMFHGPVGSGKTEFAATACAAAGVRLWSVAECDENGQPYGRDYRIAAIRLSSAMLKGKPKVALLVDEAEDVLTKPKADSAARASFSKVHLNRALETNPVPIIWTSNDLGDTDPATVRRMSLAIRIGIPDRPARTSIWSEMLSAAGIEVGPDVPARLSGDWNVTPSLAANAVRVAALTGGGVERVELAISGVSDALGFGPSRPEHGDGNFDLGLANTSADLPAIMERLSGSNAARGWSMCLYGASGTGKSAYARALAKQMGLEVVVRRPSDLLGAFVGQTEQNIAAAFAAARRKRGLLLLDEADSMLLDRGGASQSWQITAVNEMLTWMEEHTYPFVATTNLFRLLDKATLRRFTFKICFRTMEAHQARAAFHVFFGMECPWDLPSGLASGDFANVRSKARIMDERDPAVLAEWLAEEVAAKEDGNSNPVGFQPPRASPAPLMRLVASAGKDGD